MTRFIDDLGKVPVLRVLFPMVTGIFLERSSLTDQFPAWLILLVPGLVIFFLVCSFFIKGDWSLSIILAPLALFMFFVGAGILHSREIMPPESACFTGVPVYISGIVDTDPVEKTNTYALIFEAGYLVSKDASSPLDQKMLLYLPKDSLQPAMSPGERWLLRGRVEEITNKGNPGEFDYSGYMQRKGITYRVFAERASLVKLSSSQEGKLKYLPGKIRKKIRSRWDMHNPDHAVLSAITLGDKSMIPDETRDAFVGSGAMHLLAVSGLHVGMIWWILDLIIVFPRRKAAFRFLKLSLILGILWMYAGITGFSESVCRSVTMFSLISLARATSRNSNIYNNLFLSAFILLVIDPLRIEEPGFQLSYLAVFGIVSIHPILVSYFPVSNKLLKKVTDLVFVSISAQLATLPVSLFYFHQFPLYFIATNILAIPLVSVLLALFVLFSPFFLLDFHADLFLWVLEKLTHILNLAVELVSSLPGSAIREIPMSVTVCLLLLLTIFSLTACAIYKRVSWLISAFGFACCILLISAYLRIPRPDFHELYIYNFRDHTAITSVSNSLYTDYLFYEDGLPDSYIKDYLITRGKMDRRNTEYTLNEIQVDHLYSAEHLSGDDQSSGSWMMQLCEGAWCISSGRKKILILGGCRSNELDKILEYSSWDIVVFRKDCPWITEVQAEYLSSMLCIADGSIQDYRMRRIKAVLPGIFVTSEAGAWSKISR